MNLLKIKRLGRQYRCLKPWMTKAFYKNVCNIILISKLLMTIKMKKDVETKKFQDNSIMEKEKVTKKCCQILQILLTNTFLLQLLFLKEALMFRQRSALNFGEKDLRASKVPITHRKSNSNRKISNTIGIISTINSLSLRVP